MQLSIERCKWCRRPVQWITLASGRGIVALDGAPAKDGAFVVVNGRALATVPRFRRAGTPAFDLHRRSCPQAQKEYETHVFPMRQLSFFT